jgi:hypothetical protein
MVVTVAELTELSLLAPPVLTSPAMPSSSGSFKVVEDAKAMQIRAGLNPE